MDGPQTVRQGAQLLRQLGVGGSRVGPQGVAAVRRDDDGAQDGEGRVGGDERDVGVPLVRPAAVIGVDAERVAAVGGRDRRMGDRGAEQPPERLVAVLVQMVLAAEEDDLVGQQRGPDGRDGLGREIRRGGPLR